MKRLALACLGLVAACVSPADDVGADEASVTVHPTGSTHPAALEIRVPAEAVGTHSEILLDGRPVAPNVVIPNLALGEHVITVNRLRDKVVLSGTQPNVYELAGIRFLPLSITILGLNHKNAEGKIDGRVKLAHARGGSIELEHLYDGSLTGPDQIILTPAGDIHARWGAGDGTSLVATNGQVTAADLGTFAGRRSLHLQAPHRNLPSASSVPATWRLYGIGHGPYSEFADARVDDGASLYVGYEGEGRVQLSLPAMTGDSVLVELAPVGTLPSVTRVGRIDVDDVRVTTLGGEVTVKGRYKLSPHADGWVFAAPTATGVDVMPGTYTVKTTYSTPGATGEHTQTVTVD